MSKLKLNAVNAIPQGPSSAYNQLSTFSHQYDRGGAPINGKTSYTNDQAADHILRDHAAWVDQNHSGTIELTYSFLTRAPSNFAELDVGRFSAFSALQQQQAKLSMQSWADVAKVTFTQAASGGDGHMSFGNYDGDNGGAAFAFLPGTAPGHDGESWYMINSSYQVNATPGTNNYGRQTLTHEIGHTLGLSHPGDYNAGEGNPTYADADYAQDTRGYSVMSYWSETNTGQSFKGAYSSAPLLDDITAIQKLYGANFATRAGDTTYGFNSTADRDYYSATSSSSKLVFAVWDGGGKDTLDFSGYTNNQKINLNEGSFSDVGGLVGNVSIAKGVVLENAIGGSGSDLLIGNSAANELRGGAGNDLIYGGAGADKLWGGTGADTFVFGASSDSRPGTADSLMDFVSGQDKIDLSGLPEFASSHIPLTFVSAFGGVAGQATLVQTSTGSNLSIDFTGDRIADFLVSTVGQAATTDIVV
ncbi:serralysin family metalloprotease [Pseudomonas sp. RIT-PI-S]|uniref:serralysin family metalloprotease n=1 Tax=Pseudomonas sp. RIT-PI-S TaxID=3035295 RepID=UPI0021DA0988|nr:serralysin family metalloprotease [Pseudomonas sp. RIT-PI-S]